MRVRVCVRVCGYHVTEAREREPVKTHAMGDFHPQGWLVLDFSPVLSPSALGSVRLPEGRIGRRCQTARQCWNHRSVSSLLAGRRHWE